MTRKTNTSLTRRATLAGARSWTPASVMLYGDFFLGGGISKCRSFRGCANAQPAQLACRGSCQRASADLQRLRSDRHFQRRKRRLAPGQPGSRGGARRCLFRYQRRQCCRRPQFRSRAREGRMDRFLDDDDVWFPNKLELQVAEVQRTGADLVACDSVKFFPDGHESIQRVRRPDGWTYAKAISHHDWCAIPSTVIVRKQIFDVVGGLIDARVVTTTRTCATDIVASHDSSDGRGFNPLPHRSPQHLAE